MSWMKVDDKFHSHPKVLELFNGPCPEAAVALWTLAGSWCSDQLTDGFVPVVQVRRLGFDVAAADELTRVGLWLRSEGGFQFHEWTNINPSREKVLRDRERGRERAAESRRRRGLRPNDSRTFGEASAEASGSVRPNDGAVRPNIDTGSREVNRDGSEASPGTTSPDMSARPVHPNAADVRPKIREVHLTRPDPNPYLTTDAREGLMERARSRLTKGYAQRYEGATKDAWFGESGSRSYIGTVAAYCAAKGEAELESRVEALLDGVFADPWLGGTDDRTGRPRRWPWSAIAKDPARYVTAPPSPEATKIDALRAKLDALKAERDAHLGRDIERVRAIEAEQERVKAALRKARAAA